VERKPGPLENLVIVKEQLLDTYKGKKVFLTGHTGFKGAWLLKILHMLGAQIKGYSLAPEDDKNLYNLINGDTLCNSVIADIRNRDRLVQEITAFEPDFIFHLAAQPLVRLSYDIPAYTFEVNAIGTANVLDGIRQLKGECKAVMITTDKVYHNHEWVYPYREDDRLGGYDPYSASKACTELVIDSYRNSFFNLAKYSEHKKAIAVGRAGNVIGGGDWSKDRLLPDIAVAISQHKEVIIRNPGSVRPWQHVLEPLSAYLLLGCKLAANPEQYAEAYNFGPNADDTLTVEQMVKLAIDEWGQGGYQVVSSNVNPHEAGLLKLDISKATAELGYKPSTSAANAVTFTIDWYKNHYNQVISDDEFTQNQINHFFKTTR
jgi:CDP-glucose 4,6-dehydratase